MSRISFMVNFPWGEPTFFKEKISSCFVILSKQGGIRLPDGSVGNPKLHTIRKSPFLTRFVGRPIQMYNWIGVPYKKGSRHHVFQEIVLDGFQQIGIITTPTGMIGITVYENGTRRELSPSDVQELIKNDGLTVEQFQKYFHKPECWSEYTMFIYHWTKFRY